MENTPIGLNPQATAETVEGSNSLLADLQIFYQNVRGFHWADIRGCEFFELHAKFEELYTDLSTARSVEALWLLSVCCCANAHCSTHRRGRRRRHRCADERLIHEQEKTVWMYRAYLG